ncbi:hypothetical protein QM012_000276 [Aureobasidium pullulans]|uniref:Uncharacterized protein n=1 Tax=Aureobasidium pullulans TaxID=5580 RepID=A0ABR0TV84_AURPU
MSSLDSIPGAYWPHGWSKEFLLHATSSDIPALSEDEKNRMFDSLRSALGTDGFKELMTEASRNHKARVAQEEAARFAAGGKKIQTIGELRETEVPLYMKALQQYYPGEQAWEFVVFETCCYDDDERWSHFRIKWDAVIASSFDKAPLVEGISDVNRRFTINWVEDPQLDNASLQQVTQQYGSFVAYSEAVHEACMPEMCLVVNEASLQSFFDSKNPDPDSMGLGNNHSVRSRNPSGHTKGRVRRQSPRS